MFILFSNFVIYHCFRHVCDIQQNVHLKQMIFFDRDKKINSIIRDKKLLRIRSIRKLQNMLNKKKIVIASIKRFKNLKKTIIKRFKNLKKKKRFAIINDAQKQIVRFA